MDKFSTFQGGNVDVTNQIELFWVQAKAPLLVPLLKLLVTLCLGMSIMLFVERVYMGFVILLVKIFGRKPEKKYNWEPLKDDLEIGNSTYPMVLVQIPMYNEKEVSFILPLHDSLSRDEYLITFFFS